MIIRQISVLLENRPGAITELLAVLKEHEVNLRASSLAESGEFGIFRIVVNDPDHVEEILCSSGFNVRVSQALVLTLDDDSGSLYENMLKLSTSGINVVYTYGFAACAGSPARVILKVDNLNLAAKILEGQDIRIANPHDEDEEMPEFYW